MTQFSITTALFLNKSGLRSQFSMWILFFLFVQSSSNRGTTETAQATLLPTSAKTSSETHNTDVAPALPELLGDIPFTLAPHILAMQMGLPLVPDVILPHDINDKLANFCYDFTLENSVLCEPWLCYISLSVTVNFSVDRILLNRCLFLSKSSF